MIGVCAKIGSPTSKVEGPRVWRVHPYYFPFSTDNMTDADNMGVGFVVPEFGVAL